MLTRLRGNLNSAVSRVAYVLQKLNLSPNLVTLTGLALSLLAIPIAFYRNNVLLFLIIVMTSFMDVLDGALARLSKRVTAFGGVLDSLCDRIEESIFLFSLHLTGVSMYIVFVAFAVSYTISYLRSLGEVRGVKMEGVGLMERGERLVLIAIAALLSAFSYRLNILLNISVSEIPVVVLVVLGTITIIQRILHLYTNLKSCTKM